MDILFSELWQALKSMDGVQWIILLALATIIGVGFFYVFNWLYRSRSEAQESLIDLKDKLIEHYKNSSETNPKQVSLVEVLPEDWTTHLGQVAKQLEELLDQAETGADMNYISSNLGHIIDADVYVHYIRLFHSLSDEEAQSLKHEQETWLRKRRIVCEDAVEHPDGTMGPFEYNMAFIHESKLRLQVLKTKT